MNAKTLAHNIQVGLKLTSGLSVKRSHIHELVASAFGYGSLAALQASDILCVMPPDVTSGIGIPKADIARRALALGYSAVDAEGVAVAVAKQIEGTNLLPLSLESLLDRLMDGGYDGIADDFPIGDEGQYLDLNSAPVASALTEAAERGDARAHLALAIMNSKTWEDSDPDAGRYWFEQGQKGKSLAGVEKEWADSYRDRCEADARAMSHLHSAANLGHPDALLLMAVQHGDMRFFDLHEPVVRASAKFVAEAAEEAQRTDAMWHWMEVAAAGGDIDAVCRLIDRTSDTNHLESWTWYELGKLHGIDLVDDRYRAVHEDGSVYDDDVGGRMEIAGYAGIVLPQVDDSIKQRARKQALGLYRGDQP